MDALVVIKPMAIMEESWIFVVSCE